MKFTTAIAAIVVAAFTQSVTMAAPVDVNNNEIRDFSSSDFYGDSEIVASF
jgi:hypothetical protein